MSAPSYETILESKDEIIKNLLRENEKLRKVKQPKQVALTWKSMALSSSNSEYKPSLFDKFLQIISDLT